MPNIHPESALRDYLAEHLELIEPGLQFLDTEHELRNPSGAGGFVDILARDRFGLLVVIELKRSDQAARQALQELYKYMTLLCVQHNLGSTQARAILLSTDWHELLVPFSSFAANAPFDVTGRRLLLGNDGWPVDSEQVELLQISEELDFCPRHDVLLYNDATRREADLPGLLTSLDGLGVTDYFVMLLDYTGGGDHVVTRFASWVVLTALSPVQRMTVEATMPDEFDWAEEEESAATFLHEEAILAALNSRRPRTWDDLEIGHPDKLRVELDRWSLRSISRAGRLSSQILWPDNVLLGFALGEGRQYSTLFIATSSPRHTHAWATTRESLKYCLLGAEPWADLVDALLTEIEAGTPAASVSIRIFSPCDVLWGLYGLASQGDGRYLPSLEVMVAPDGEHPARVIEGGFTWDGRTVPGSVEETVGRVFEDAWEYLTCRHLGEQWHEEAALVDLHGLSYTAFEWQLIDDVLPVIISAEDGVLRRVAINDEAILPLLAFEKRCQTYLQLLASAIGVHVRTGS